MNIKQETVNAIRILSAETVQKANSGHPGAPMGMAPMAYALWMEHLNISPKNPLWIDRDRFVLSSGHASALLYTLLHLTKFDISKEDLMNFRQFHSKTPGHPEIDQNLGIEISTGPLGQGIANAVGMAIAETKLAARFNKEGYEIINHRTYAICGDGCLMEGISSEAASLAGTLGLSKLTILYDDNEISIEGSTDLAFKEDVGKRFEAFGWQVIKVDDGNDLEQISKALELAKNDDRPSFIICPTIIGYGSEAKQGRASAHGEPLGQDSLKAAKEFLGVNSEAFSVSDRIKEHLKSIVENKNNTYQKWLELFEAYKINFQNDYKELDKWLNAKIDLQSLLNQSEFFEAKSTKMATRSASGNMINMLAKQLPNLIGGSADLAPSNKSAIIDGGSYSKENRFGRNLHFGVREHAMAAICNGIAAHGGFHVFCSTFFVFSDYMKNAMRMSALMRLPVIYVLTHDSIGVGEDGATHQPIEQLAGLRSIPDMQVFRPADVNETAYAWLQAICSDLPSCLVLSRQDLPLLTETKNDDNLKGAYVVKDCRNADVIILASGSELNCAFSASVELEKDGISSRVVSVPCMENFNKQSTEYKTSILPDTIRHRVSLEAGATMPWYRYVGLDGLALGIDSFGLSAPGDRLFEHFGINGRSLVKAVKGLLNK